MSNPPRMSLCSDSTGRPDNAWMGAAYSTTASCRVDPFVPCTNPSTSRSTNSSTDRDCPGFATGCAMSCKHFKQSRSSGKLMPGVNDVDLLCTKLGIQHKAASACKPNSRRAVRVGQHSLTTGSWSAAEDEDLLKCINNHLRKSPLSTLPWADLGRRLQLPRSGQQCQSRYYETLDPKILRGRWTPDLDTQLLHFAKQHRNCWARISDAIGSKTQRQCRSRWVALQRKRSLNYHYNLDTPSR